MLKIVYFFLISLLSAGLQAGFVKDGIVDVSKLANNESGIEAFKGSTFFFKDRFIEPGEMSLNELKEEAEKNALMMELPEDWIKSKHADKLKRLGYGTYVFFFRNNSSEKRISLSFSGFNAATEFRINEIPGFKVNMGTPGTDAKSEVPWAQYKVFKLPVENLNEFALIIKMSCFNRDNGGILTFPGKIGESTAIEEDFIRERFRAFSIMGILFILGLYHLTLFLLRREDKPSMAFSILCFIVFLRLCGFGRHFNFLVDESMYHIIFPLNYFWDYASVNLAACSIVYFCHCLSPEIISKTFNKIYALISIVLVAGILYHWGPAVSHVMLKYLQLYLLVGFLTVIIKMAWCAFAFGKYKKATEIRKLCRFLLFFMFTGLSFAVNDILHNLKIINTAYVAEIGMLFFFGGQSFLLAKMFSGAYRKAEFLNESLKSEVDAKTEEINGQKAIIQEQLSTIQSDLEVASDVMTVMLPSKSIQGKNYNLEIFFKPALELAGDLYGQELSGDRQLFWVCDVTGHGIASSMVAGVVRESIATTRNKYIFDGEPDPAGCLAEISENVNKAVKGKFFATMSIAVWNIETRVLTLSSAAHLSPLLFGEKYKKVTPLRVKNGPLIGQVDSKMTGYHNVEFNLTQGDNVFVFTDGLNEGFNKETKIEYGKNRVKRYLKKHGHEPDINERIFRDMIEFQGREEMDDDVSLACFRVI